MRTPLETRRARFVRGVKFFLCGFGDRASEDGAGGRGGGGAMSYDQWLRYESTLRQRHDEPRLTPWNVRATAAASGDAARAPSPPAEEPVVQPRGT